LNKPPLLQVKNIHKAYPDAEREVLSGINFQVQKGESLAILGYSGEGKTTLLHILAGMLDAEEGEVLLDGKKVLGPADKLVPGHADIRLVYQHYGLDHSLTVKQNIAHRMLGFKPEIIEKRGKKLMKWCMLEHVAEQRVEKLSGGEKQRLALARAVADYPMLLLLDEPFSNIDLTLRNRFKQSLKEMAIEDGFSMIMVTHDYQDAFFLADKLLVLKNGKIIREGSPEEVYKNPQKEDVALLLGAQNILGKGKNKRWVKEESIRMKAYGKGLPGTILSKTFMGDWIEYRVQTNDWGVLVLKSGDRDYAKGKYVVLEWEPDAEAQLS
jgi:ABC-type sulfate/molybdate transport systems ATPase subunit